MYLRLMNGNVYVIWSQVNRDVVLLEGHYRGVMPPADEAQRFQEIIEDKTENL